MKKIIHGTIFTMTGEVIRDGAVLFDTKIRKLGTTTELEQDPAEELDVQGAYVYPGLIDAHSHLGMFEDSLGFEYPIIIKPSASAVYWHYPFDGMKKVYTAASKGEAEIIIRRIYGSGYPEKIILQDMIPGDDSKMRVLTAYSDRSGKVRMMCLGHVLLEEHTPKGLGNHAAIVTEPVSSLPIADKIKDMLEALGYTGFSNFDIKLREGTKDDFRVFEINLRQGRSNFYLTSAGLNVAYLANEVYESDGKDCNKVENVVFWHHIPKSTAYKYTEDKALVEKAKKLAREGREFSSVWYTPDMRFNPLRIVCVLEQLRRQKGKFKKYYPVKK